MYLRYSLSLAGAALLLSCGHRSGPNPTFKRLDQNHDERVTVDEFTRHLNREGFGRLDRDADGWVSFEEWRLRENQEASEKIFRVLDQNKDGRLSRDEFSSSPRKKQSIGRIFRSLDRNQDGALEWSEVAQVPAM